jgi:bifunctional non-homologous end joining protein LigD
MVLRPGAGRKPRPEPAGEPAEGRRDDAPAPLDKYRRMRDPDRTPEPFGGVPAASGEPRFVIQQHRARAMHWDFRLEIDGVLRSWAVPKGPSVRVEEKRLAVHVEDHPLEYANFEGVIPSGNYGAGAVIVWDHGTFRSFKPEPIAEQYARGKLELEMFGLKLGGRWTLVRSSRSAKDWLLLKKKDGAAADVEATERWPRSVVSGLTVAEMADTAAWSAALRDEVAATGAPRAEVRAARVQPMLATLVEKPFTRQDWVFEIKYDGVRVVAEKRADEVRMYGRSGEDITARYPEVAFAMRYLVADDLVVDGEIIAFDAAGKPSFARLQKRMLLSKPRDIAAARARVPVRAVFFDLLALEGHDLRGLPLTVRKHLLARALPPAGVAAASGHVAAAGEAFFEAASEMGLEGVIGKRADSRYVGKRSPDWVKIKCQRRQEFVVGGYTDPKGGGRHFGALHVGIHEDGGLRHVTRVGSGFDDALQNDLWERLKPLRRDTSPFGTTGPKGRENHWVEPRLVCEVRFTEWTEGGGLRHPIFLGLRTDRKPEDVRREDEADVPDIDVAGVADASAEPAAAPKTKRAAPAPEERIVRLSNLKKVFWPGEGITKGDLIAYYDRVAPLFLPYLRDRPVVLTRYPDGIAGKSFYQKDAPVYVPDWMRTESVYSKESDRDIRFFVLDDAESLRYVANLGTIPIHMWSSRSGSLERPDWLVLDLDPKGAPFAHVVEVGRAIHDILDELGLPSYPKTSGATGLHILIPLGRRYTHDECRTFARVLAMLGLEAKPEISTVARPLSARGGKVYIDWGQNGHGITIAAPYSLRPRPGAPASCPLLWSEVNDRLNPDDFNLRTLPERFEKMEDPLLPILGSGVDMGAALAAIRGKLESAKGESGGADEGDGGGAAKKSVARRKGRK